MSGWMECKCKSGVFHSATAVRLQRNLGGCPCSANDARDKPTSRMKLKQCRAQHGVTVLCKRTCFHPEETPRLEWEPNKCISHWNGWWQISILLYTYVYKYLGCFYFLVGLLRESLAPVQFSLAVEAALFEVFHQSFVHPLLQQRELGGGERKQRKGIGKAGEEINGSVQEEWWRGIEKAVNSPFCSTRAWQEFHSLLVSLPTRVHSSESSHIWLPGWGVNFL